MDTYKSVVSKGSERLKSIASANGLGEDGVNCAVSVLFAANARPTVQDVRLLSTASGNFLISLDPTEDSPNEIGWLELLANGLTFDCSGLAPGPSEEMPPRRHNFALPPDLDVSGAEVITLIPGPHLAGGVMMFPVLRVLAWLGAVLSELPGALAVVWHGASSFNGPEHFRSGVYRWIEGGAFPGLGLTALAPTAQGGLRSEGLAMFTGQEIELIPDLASDRAEGAKLALRLVHWLVENGRIDAPSQLAGPSGEILLLELVNDKQIIKVSKSS